MSFKDKYPRICDAICPRCKRTCMHKMEMHNIDGVPSVHVCGPHWWIRIETPYSGGPIEINGNVPLSMNDTRLDK